MKYKIRQIADIIDGDRGKNYPKQNEFHNNGFCLFLNTGNVTTDGFSFVENQFITEEKDNALRKGKLQRGDIVYTTRGTVGNAGFYSNAVPYDNVRINSGMVILRCNNLIVDTRFLYQILKSSYYRPYFKKYCTGSAQPQLPIKNMSTIELEIPSIEIQHRIADILSSYDDLIENNRKQIKLLEEAAQRLYKEWFVDLRFPGHEETPIVDGVPAGWERKSIEDIADYLNGYAFKPSDWGKSGKPIIKIKELNEGITQDTPRNSGENIPVKYIVYPGEIIFSWSATLTAKIWNGEIGLLNQHLFKVTPYKGIAREFVLQSILWSLDEFHNLTTGSTMKHIQRGKLKQVFVNMPNEKLMKEFGKQTDFCRKKILLLNHKIQLLQESRDRLLPKLMSGEIEV